MRRPVKLTQGDGHFVLNVGYLFFYLCNSVWLCQQPQNAHLNIVRLLAGWQDFGVILFEKISYLAKLAQREEKLAKRV